MSSAHSNEPLTSLSVRKSNDFVTAKYSSSLLENQIMAISLTRIENSTSDDGTSPLIARLYPGELKRLISDSTHIYRDLKVVSKRMVGHNFFIEDGKGNFRAHAIITDAVYENGIFTVKFNEVLREHILGLERNYTTYELSVMTDFKKNSSFRLYEVLKKEIYKIKPKDYKSFTQAEYNLSELRFIIGLANSDDPIVKNTLSRTNGIVDWDELYRKLDKKDKKYEEWRDFQRRVLKPAQEELEEKSDIRFEYESIREGRKTGRILFTIYRNIPKNPDIIDEKTRFMEEKSKEYRQYEIPMDLPELEQLYDDYVGHNFLSKNDIDLLLEKAHYSKETVINAIELADKQPEINNYMGWLIKCIENDYINNGTVKGSVEDYKITSEIKSDVKENRPSIAKNVWERFKQKEDFEDFMFDIFENLTIDQVELAYTDEELCKMYTDWTKQK